MENHPSRAKRSFAGILFSSNPVIPVRDAARKRPVQHCKGTQFLLIPKKEVMAVKRSFTHGDLVKTELTDRLLTGRNALIEGPGISQSSLAFEAGKWPLQTVLTSLMCIKVALVDCR